MVSQSFDFSLCQASPVSRAGDDLPDAKFDCDGIYIPEFWRPNVKGWEKQALEVRQRLSTKEIAYCRDLMAKMAKEDARRPSGPRAKNFSTAYAIAWGKSQGWTLVEWERFDHRTKRHMDASYGMDAIFQKPDGSRVGVQGAGRYEREHHYKRFIDRTEIPEKRDHAGRLKQAHVSAEDVCRKQSLSIAYLEFNRDSKVPHLIEWWVS